MSNMVVRTNVMSLNSHRNLGLNGNMQARSAARLSSGFRINSAADDAAGLAISEKMRSQIRGLDQASRNAQDGISLIQTAEGAMQTVNEMVTRIRELVIQAANDTNAHDADNLAQSDRKQIQREINQLLQEIDQVTLRTEFNTRTLLDGSLGGNISLSMLGVGTSTIDGLDITVGADGTITFPPTTNDTDHAALNETFRLINQIGGTDVRHLVAVMNATGVGWSDDLAQMISDLGDELALIAGDPNTHQFGTSNNLESAFVGNVTVNDVTRAIDTLTRLHTAHAASNNDGVFSQWSEGDVVELGGNWVDFGDWADNMLEDIMYETFEERGSGVWFQIGANQGQGIRLELDSVNVRRLHEVATNHTQTIAGFNMLNLRNTDLEDGVGVMRADGGEIDQFVAALDAALAHVTGERAHLGAVQNRLEFTIENLDTASENLSASNSRIRDADMAREMMAFTQSNVLQQAAISMLAQANMAPQNILQLLG